MKKLTVSVKFFLVILSMLLLSNMSFAQENSSEIDQDDYILTAKKAFSIGQWEQGKTILDLALIQNTKDSDLRLLLGKYYLHFNDYDKARYELVKAIQISPNNLDAKALLVQVETLSKRYSSAICYVNELLEHTPYAKELWLKKIDLYALQNNNVEVQRLQKRLLQIFPQSKKIVDSYLETVEKQAVINRKEGNLEQSLTQSLELVRNSPDNVAYYLDVINDYLKVGELDKALAFTDKAISKVGLDHDLVYKKIGILEQQDDYKSLLDFLKSNSLHQQYNYYLLEAARSARAKEAVSLYAKVLDKNPTNEESFNYVFNDQVEKHQYEHALHTIALYRSATRDTKELGLKEIMVYKLLGNESKAQELSQKLFFLYTDDLDLKATYLQNILEQAKQMMLQQQYLQAREMWYELSKYQDQEMELVAQKGLYSAYVQLGDYSSALNALNTALMLEPMDVDLHIKKSDLYYKQNNYHMAISSYEKGLSPAHSEQLQQHNLKGYEELLTKIVSDLNQRYLYTESYGFVERWLAQDPTNLQGLKYHINLANQLGIVDQGQKSLQLAQQYYPDDVFFKVKSAQVQLVQNQDYEFQFQQLIEDLNHNAHHPDLLNTLEQVAINYSNVLVKQKQNVQALNVVDQALGYMSESNELKYAKGLILEKLKQYDQALVYQSSYEPSLLDFTQFKQQLRALEYKTFKNEVGLEYIRNKFGVDQDITSVAAIQYTRLEQDNSYTGKLNYTARELGKGVQFVGSWNHKFNSTWSSYVNLGMGGDYFPSFLVDASVFKEVNFLQGLELELGIGYRKFKDNLSVDSNQDQMYNLVLGATKQSDVYRINVKLNNIFISNSWLYNLSINSRYYFSSSKHFISALAGIGSSPDVELIDYQFYDGFSVLNTNVGLGYNFMVYKNVSAGIMGTWYNYKAEDLVFKNLYNLYFNLNVAF